MIEIYLNSNGAGCPPRLIAHRCMRRREPQQVGSRMDSTRSFGDHFRRRERSWRGDRAVLAAARRGRRRRPERDRGRQIADELGGLFARTDVTDEASVQPRPRGGHRGAAGRRSAARIGWASRTVAHGTPHDLASYQKVIAVNLIGTFNLMRIAAAARRGRPPTPTASAASSSTPPRWRARKRPARSRTPPTRRRRRMTVRRWTWRFVGVRVNTICPRDHRHPNLGYAEKRRGVQDPAGGPGVPPSGSGTGGHNSVTWSGC